MSYLKTRVINDPFSNWIEQWLRKWKGLMISVLTSLIIVMGSINSYRVLHHPLCCGLVQRLIETVLTKQGGLLLHSGQMLLMNSKYQTQLLLVEFEEKRLYKKGWEGTTKERRKKPACLLKVLFFNRNSSTPCHLPPSPTPVHPLPLSSPSVLHS